MLSSKTILIGVTGGIAAYKTADLIRHLVKKGAKVHVIMTAAATKFITPLTLQTLSQNKVWTDIFDEESSEVSHISLAQQADLFCIAPATANIIAKMAAGIADDLLSTCALATTAPILLAPAMNVQMYQHPAVQENIGKLTSWGCHMIGPAEGELACGVKAKGRMTEPEEILNKLAELVASKDLKGLKILVTAGGTKEKIDPVRFIANRSSGKMGFAIAQKAQRRGAEVTLIAGNVTLPEPSGVKVIRVESALEMYDQVLQLSPIQDVIIKSAAVADYRVDNPANHKIKKGEGELVLKLVPNPDVLKQLGQQKSPGQVLVGFAAETENLEQAAKTKLTNKNLDLIIANNVLVPGAGFESDTNAVTIIDKLGEKTEVPMMSKDELADFILDKIIGILNR